MMRMGRNWMIAAGAAGVAMGLRRAFPPSFTFAGKAVLVTGASRGLGLVLSRELARQGAQLAICARDAAELERARAELKSIGGDVAIPHLLPYVGSKYAAVGFSEGLAVETARHGIRVTTILPFVMRTGSHWNALFKGRRDREVAWFAIGASLPLTSVAAERAA